MTLYQPLPSPAPRQPQSSSNTPLKILAVLLFLIILFLGSFLYILFEADEGETVFGKKVAIVEIFGGIYDAEDEVELLEDCQDSSSIVAVVLHIDSPGGAIAPTQQIYDAAKKISDDGKPVIAFMSDVAASGGYLAACAGDEIYAMSGTLTGSIGVYMQTFNVAELLKRWGIVSDTVKKGSFKTAGDFTREMEGYERAMFQSLVDDYYQQFIDAVAENRSRNRLSIARGWNQPLPGGAIGESTKTAQASGASSLPTLWAGIQPGLAGLSIASVSAPTVAEATVTAVATQVPSATASAIAKKVDQLKLLALFASNLTDSEIRKRVETLSEGRVYTGRQAYAVGLVDRIGTLDEAVARAGKLAGIDGKPKKVTKRRDREEGLFNLMLRTTLGYLPKNGLYYLCPIGK